MSRALTLLLCLAFGLGRAATLDDLVADRAAIERVYYQHRIGATTPFAEALPAAALRRLVERDLARENALRARYGVEISSRQIAAEVERIDRSTRAPEVLAQIKAALGDDPRRYALSFVKPIVVERELRNRFANDDDLHAPVRHECELARTNLLAARLAGASPAALVSQLTHAHPARVQTLTWRLASPSPAASAPHPRDPLCFDDLPPQLRQVLAVQLRAPGDISAVIETPETFLLFVAEAKTPNELVAASLSLPKMDCDTWLTAQNPQP
jgi:hypothetical protein